MKRKHILPLVLIILGTILYFMANVQRTAVPGAIFDILQNDLQVVPASITALGASFMYLYAISQLFTGLLVSRYGGFRVIRVGAIIFAIGCLLFPLTSNMIVMYLSRGLIGIGSSTFYIGMIQEVQKIISKNNFGVALSVILLVGYLGSIIANAPLVFCIGKLGWRPAFVDLAILTIVITLLFLLITPFVKKQAIDKTVKLKWKTYKKVLTDKYLINFYIFSCLNYSLYFVLQTVIGKKFLEDFTQIPTMQAAIILSVMGGLYAIAGPILATISKMIANRRVVFLRIAACNTLFTMIIILTATILNFKNSIIGMFFLPLSFFACLTPLLVPLIYDYSDKRIANVSMSVMTSIFFFISAILSNVIGLILNYFPKSTTANGIIVHSNYAYISIFILATILATISLHSAWKIKDSKLTMRYIHIKHIGNH